MRVYVYGDESGNFDFSNGPGASRYFILTSVTVADHAIESDLQELRRQLTWEGESLASGFHATNDKQRVRDRVFAVMARHDFRVDATILEKRKTDPGRRSQPRLYSLAWYLHLAGLIPELVAVHDELLLIAASIGARDMRSEFQATVENIVGAQSPPGSLASTMWPSATAPLLQVADYCAWAIQRKWERSDTRAYNLVRHRIASEFEAFRESEPTRP